MGGCVAGAGGAEVEMTLACDAWRSGEEYQTIRANVRKLALFSLVYR